MRLLRKTRVRMGLAVIGVVVAVLAGVVLLLGGGGVWETYPAHGLATAAGRRDAPAWTRSCRRAHLDRTTVRCVMVKGRIIWVQHHDGDGDGDRHLLVATRLRVRVVKVPLALGVDKVPGRGTVVTAIGYDRVGGSGSREILAERLKVPGRTYVLARAS